jgi:hypothetical protein
MMRKFLLLLTVIAPVMLMAFTDSRAATITGNFVAEVTASSGSNSAGGPTPFVAVVTAQDKAIAYICDGEKMAEWFRGSVQAGGLFEVKSTTQQARIIAQIGSRSVVGNITLEGGRVVSFRATPVDGDAGLYRSDDTINDQRFLGGWVVSASGEQRGAVIGGGSTRPGRRLELRGTVINSNLPELGVLRPFQVNAEFVRKL